jgi:MFS family permease
VSATAAAAPSSRYRALLRIPHVRRLLATAFVGRLPVGMMSLSLVLLVSRATGSYASAGVVTGAQAIGAGVFAPIAGRLMDRLGQTRVLVTCAIVFPCSVAALIAVAEVAPHTAPLAACALVFGLSYPPLFAALRTLLSQLAGASGMAETAFALEATMQELFFILGPLSVGLIVAVASPQAALAALGVLATAGTLGFAASEPSRHRRGGARPAGPARGLLASGAMRALLAVSATYGIAFGTLEVAIPAFCSQHASAGVAGVVLASNAAGSIAGGLLYGSRAWTADLADLLARFGTLFAVAMVPIAFATSIPMLLVAMPVAGLFIAPWAAVSYALIGRIAPPEAISEAFTWEATAVIAGFAVGGAISGVLVDGPGVRAALLFSAALAGVSAATAWLQRDALRT